MKRKCDVLLSILTPGTLHGYWSLTLLDTMPSTEFDFSLDGSLSIPYAHVNNYTLKYT
jgi:hypothetical protein